MDTRSNCAYVIGLIAEVEVNEELFVYMETVETTMHRFGGRWVSHGRTAEVREGQLNGDIVIIEFPNLDTAHAWYESDEYQAAIPLRTRNCHSVVAITEGVPTDYTTRDTIHGMRRTIAS